MICSIIGPLKLNPLSVNQSQVIYVDGGVFWRSRLGSGFAVGDGDSLDHSLAVDMLDVKVDKEKNYSDLQLAFDILEESQCHLQLHGFWGGRFDHQLATFGPIQKFLSRRENAIVELFDGDGNRTMLCFTPGNHRFYREGGFSLFTLDYAQVLLTGDCQYKLVQPTKLLPLSDHGLSNVGFGEIECFSDKNIFVIFYEEK